MAEESRNRDSLSAAVPKQDGSSQDTSAESSNAPSGSGSGGPSDHKAKEGHRVKFSVGGDSFDSLNERSTLDARDDERGPPKKPIPGIRFPPQDERDHPKKPLPGIRFPPQGRQGSAGAAKSYSPSILDSDISADVTESPLRSRTAGFDGIMEEEDEGGHEKAFSQLSAQERAQRLASLLSSNSAPTSRRNSMDSTVSPKSSPPPSRRNSTRGGFPDRTQDIPMMDLGHKGHYDDSTDDDEEGFHEQGRPTSTSRAHQLVRAITRKNLNPLKRVHAPSPGLQSGQVTPEDERHPDWVPRPKQYRDGVLGALLKLYDEQGMGSALRGDMPSGAGVQPKQYRDGSGGDTNTHSPNGDSSRGSSGVNTPRRERREKWYDKSANQSTSYLAGLINSSTMLASPGASSAAGPRRQSRPSIGPKSKSSGGLTGALHRMSKPKLEDEIRITVHIAEILSRQKYLLQLCRALMNFGAPTHRLEEYMRMTARVLEIDGQFLYIPGCMLVSFDDATTHTTEVKLVRSAQGVDLGRLRDTHEIYKEVVHDKIGVEEATQRLDEVMRRKPKFNKWILVFMYGCASAFVGPFAFSARPIDMPIAFFLGCVLGWLQLVVAPKSDLYSNVFEISASVLTSFLARAFGSIRIHGTYQPFCFSALAQSAIALILPGYTVLCGSLELQSRSIVAGSVRMVYAIIYSLFLGFGITIGTAFYGLIDKNASSTYTCPASPLGTGYLAKFPFVPLFTMCLIIINQAKWRQSPVMLFIAFAGYVVNYFSAKRFASNAQVANTLGAFAVGLLGNTYSRFRHGVAAAALLPAIFVQVPSGLAASGSLVSGVTSANQITGNTTGSTVISNGTQGFEAAQSGASGVYGGTVFNVGYGMVQVAIGITVGLFLSALVVYPFGKRRSGLFSF